MTKTPYKNIIVIILLIYCDTIVATNFVNKFWIAESIYRYSVEIREKLKTIRDVFVAAVEEECTFTCPEDMKPEINRYYIPKSNGCGTGGLEKLTKFVSPEEITNCCNNHDICYDTCSSDKDVCDRDFKKCLYDHCNYSKPYNYVLQVCKVVAKTFYSTTSLLGCKSYLDSQKNACHCPPKIKYKKNSLRDGDL